MNETNEVAEVRALFGEPPAPVPQVVVAARARLTEDGAAPRRVPGTRRRTRLGTGALGLTAAAAAAAIAVTVVGQGGGSDPNGPSSGRAVLIKAAEQAESAPPSTGEYWHQATQTEELLQVGKPGRATYQVYARSRQDVWMPSDGDGTTWEKSQELGARPATKADWDVWRKEGSPAAFRMKESGQEISSKPGKPSLDRLGPGRYGNLFGQQLTPKDVLGLPADPGRLKAALLELIKRQSAGDGDEQLFTWGSSMLLHYPAPPRIRAATYRMLADLPGVRKIGTVTDRAGRTGTAVSLDIGIDDQDSRFGDRLIIDPDSGRALAEESVMTRQGADAPDTAHQRQVGLSNATLHSGWTDKAPGN